MSFVLLLSRAEYIFYMESLKKCLSKFLKISLNVLRLLLTKSSLNIKTKPKFWMKGKFLWSVRIVTLEITWNFVRCYFDPFVNLRNLVEIWFWKNKIWAFIFNKQVLHEKPMVKCYAGKLFGIKVQFSKELYMVVRHWRQNIDDLDQSVL